MEKRRDFPQLYPSYLTPVRLYDAKKQELWKLNFVKEEEKKLHREVSAFHGIGGWLVETARFLWNRYFGDECFFLCILGILVALISYTIDKGVVACNNARMWLYQDLAGSLWSQYLAWVSLPVTLIMFSAGFAKLLGPKSTGSGIPEMKTLLRGVYLKDFLTFKVLVVKVVGLTCALGSSMPVGKEGPLMHISCCCAHLLGKLASFRDIYQNKTRKLEMLAAAVAVGVGCTFGSPIGGVLLSVEITTAYYGVRNFWRGFCAAVWGTTVYRLLLVWIEGAESVTVVFKTSFFVDTPFAPQELVAFAILGVVCGLSAAFYMQMRVHFGRFIQNNRLVKAATKYNFFFYPALVTLIIVSVSFPPNMGKFMASHVGYPVQVQNLFSNFSWTSPNLTATQYDTVRNWQTPSTGIYLHLLCVMAFNFIGNIVAATVPVPHGAFIAIFRVGAAIGRIAGELMHGWYPTGRSIPGAYAMVGAAAFSGGVTHTMCVCVIAMEMTSQITHVIPILMATLISNSITQYCGSSLYDSGIKSKKLPYLPDILPRNSAMYNICVEDFMTSNLKYVYSDMQFDKLKALLSENKHIESFPLVNNPVQMILLGSIQRLQLIELLEKHVGKERRLVELSPEELQNFKSKKSNVDADGKKSIDNDEFTYNPCYERPPGVIKSRKLVKLPKKRVCDLSPRLQKRWERSQMRMLVDFTRCQIDPAPFQLVEKTSLLKVHSLFSLVGISIAYVTFIGRLVGVVSLSDLRKIIENV